MCFVGGRTNDDDAVVCGSTDVRPLRPSGVQKGFRNNELKLMSRVQNEAFKQSICQAFLQRQIVLFFVLGDCKTMLVKARNSTPFLCSKFEGRGVTLDVLCALI